MMGFAQKKNALEMQLRHTQQRQPMLA